MLRDVCGADGTALIRVLACAVCCHGCVHTRGPPAEAVHLPPRMTNFLRQRVDECVRNASDFGALRACCKPLYRGDGDVVRRAHTAATTGVCHGHGTVPR